MLSIAEELSLAMEICMAKWGVLLGETCIHLYARRLIGLFEGSGVDSGSLMVGLVIRRGRVDCNKSAVR